MKLSFPETSVETSDKFVTEAFSLGDQRVIMTLLRSKLYSSPIRTICQEIISNARDAHREVGKSNIPVVVHLPNRLSNVFKVQDFGPGISPDRMKDVFIKYGNSTKRDSDLQTGGFGLGAKSPFSYVDSFSIVTITTEDGKNVRREYCAYIDESQLGAMSLVNESETSDQAGTTIIIPCKEGDKHLFEEGVHHTASFWDVRPTIKGYPEFRWEEYKYQYISDDKTWAVSGNFDSKIIIDGIPYRLQTELICKRDEQSRIISIVNHGIHLFFGSGVLKVTASREDIDYQPDVIKIIRDKLLDINIQLNTVFSKKVSSAANWYNACVELYKLRKDWSHLIDASQIKWNGLPLVGSITFNSSYLRVARFKRDKNKLNYSYLDITPNVLFVDDDTECLKPSSSRVRTLFDQFPDVNHICVVYKLPPDKSDFSDTAAYKAAIKQYHEALEDREKRYNWSKIGLIKLSTIKPKASDIIAQSRLPEMKLYDVNKYSWTTCTAEYDKSGYYVVSTKHGMHIDPNNLEEEHAIDRDEIVSYAKMTRIKIYSIHRNQVSKLGPGWKSLYSKLKDDFDKLMADNNIAKLCSLNYDQLQLLYNLVRMSDLISSITDTGSLAYKVFEIVGSYKKHKHNFELLKMSVFGVFKNQIKKDTSGSNIFNLFRKEYPLINNIYYDSAVVPDCVFYINAKDAAKKGKI